MRSFTLKPLPLLALLLASPGWTLPTPLVRPLGRPDALVDLRTEDGARAVSATWRYHDVDLVEVEGKGPGPDLKPSGAAVRTRDYTPKAGAADFDDPAWEVLAPMALDARRGNGKLSFAWYRLRFTMPRRIGGFDPTDATVAFEIVIDDYAEVWVDGKLAPVLGQAGGAVIAGFNAPNRVIVGRDVKPGQQIQLAVFGMNGPISASPNNFIWIKSATLDFFKPQPAENAVRSTRLDSGGRRDRAATARVEKLATGFLFTEGPVWVRDGGYLLFSDPNDNRIYRWTPDGELSDLPHQERLHRAWTSPSTASPARTA